MSIIVSPPAAPRPVEQASRALDGGTVRARSRIGTSTLIGTSRNGAEDALQIEPTVARHQALGPRLMEQRRTSRGRNAGASQSCMVQPSQPARLRSRRRGYRRDRSESDRSAARRWRARPVRQCAPPARNRGHRSTASFPGSPIPYSAARSQNAANVSASRDSSGSFPATSVARAEPRAGFERGAIVVDRVSGFRRKISMSIAERTPVSASRRAVSRTAACPHHGRCISSGVAGNSRKPT